MKAFNILWQFLQAFFSAIFSTLVKAFRLHKKAVSVWIAVLVIAVVLFASVGTYYLATQILGVSPPGADEAEIFYGSITLTVAESNLLDPSSTPSTTSDSYIVYHSRGKALTEVTASDFIGGVTYVVGTGADFDVSPEDEGTILLYADAGTDFFLDYQATKTNNIGVSECRTLDVDGDHRDEYVFSIDVSDYVADPKPTKQINMIVVEEDTTITLSSPTDQDSIGTGTKTGTIEWQIEGIAEKYGGRLARVYVVSNDTTFESQAAITAVSIAGVGTFTGSDITPDSGAKTWYIDIGVDDYRELVDTHLLTRASGGSSYVGVTVSWETYFAAASDATELTLYVTMMKATESLDTADSDACILGG